MRWTIIFTATFYIVATILIPPVRAHEIKTDGTMSILLHVDPDDNVTAGQTATFYFAINDSTNRFSAANCRCTVTVKNGKKVLSTQTVAYPPKASIYGVTAKYVFPAKGDYIVELHGTPMLTGKFQPFTLSYGVPVVHETAAIKRQRELRLAGFASLGVICVSLLTYLLFQKKLPFRNIKHR